MNAITGYFWEEGLAGRSCGPLCPESPERAKILAPANILEGRGKGKGFNRNVPLPAGLAPAEYLKVFERTVEEASASFRPDMLIIAAGFDAHHRDRMGGMLLTENDYERMTSRLLASTRPFTAGKTVSFLEGGYDLPSLRDSVKAHCRALAAGPFSREP